MAATVMVVDDHEVVRRGVVELIEADPDLTVVAEAGSAEEAVTRARAVRPDLALVDLRLPDEDGITLIRRLRNEQPELKCLVLTSFDDTEAMEQALDAGASAFLLKTVRANEIVTSLKEVAGGRRLLHERSLSWHQHDPDGITDNLTPTELKVLDLVGDGLTNREIGERLGLAEKTVKNHVTSLLAKTGFRRRTQAVAWVAAKRSGGWQRQAR
ncbi:MAG TPA: response regulator transcription factor [Actinomycetales bacterium]|nr:response regulator transcription factor [Actinomycetales bacterium]